MGELMKRKITLDRFEREIENHISSFTRLAGAERAKIEGILDRARKTRNINIRIREHDLAQLKKRAEEEGIPYQTLISSVLHKYMSEKLLDERDILRSLQLMGSVSGGK